MRLILFISLFFATYSFAQTKHLTMEEAVLKQRTSLAPKRLKGLQWIKNSDQFIYVAPEGAERFVIGNADSKKTEDWLTLTSLNYLLKQQQLDTIKTLPTLKWLSSNDATFKTGDREVVLNRNTQVLAEVKNPKLPDNAQNIDETSNQTLAYTIDNNLYLNIGYEKVAVTADSIKGIVNGQIVHRNEFGIDKGTFWSNNGRYLAYYRMDESMVTDYPIIDFSKQPAQANMVKYPMAGGKSHQVTLHVFDVQQRISWQIKTAGDPEQYLTNISWSPDDKTIYIAILNRDQNTMQLNAYDAMSGNYLKTLFEEKHDKYVQPKHPIFFVPNNPRQFVWQSERDGFNHLYLYDVDGKLKKQLTKGAFVVTALLGFDAKAEKLFYISTENGALNRDLYSYHLKAERKLKLTDAIGTHRITMNDSYTYFIDDFTSTVSPREILVSDAEKGNKTQYLLIAPNPLKDYYTSPVKLFTLKAADGTDLYCRQYNPTQMDSSKKYPVIVYQYNGPNVQLVFNTWNGGGDYWFQYMADNGYVVFTIDGRGSANRGLAFEQATFRQLGTVELQDQMTGVAYLKSLPFVDANRMGIFGWSYGGFMTTYMMLQNPGVFKAGVAGGPVIDWSFYEVMYTERYMDMPNQNKDGYAANNLTKLVNKLNGHLLLIHGTDDDVVVWQHSINFIKASVDAGKQVDYFIYPGHPHNVQGKDRQHLYQKVTDYFNQHLK